MAEPEKRADKSIYNNTQNYVPKLGDMVVLMVCCGSGPRWVMRHAAPTYKCGSCKKVPRSVGEVTLGLNGALPPEAESLMLAALGGR